MGTSENLPQPFMNQPAFLMCAPKLYDVDYVINPWMEGNVKNSSREIAARQWSALHDELSGRADVRLVEPQPGSPDMVFTANAGLVREGVVALSSFRHPERQGEEMHFRKWFDESGFRVQEFPRATPFEGEGDALFEADGSRLWAGYGMRTHEASHAMLRELWDLEVVSLRLVDPRFYHLDTCFAPLSNGDLMYFPEAFDEASRKLIEERCPAEKRICVEEADALRFACNAVNAGRTIVLNRISADLAGTLEARGFQVIQLELTEFLKAGGAAKCLVLRLSEIEATHGG